MKKYLFCSMLIMALPGIYVQQTIDTTALRAQLEAIYKRDQMENPETLLSTSASSTAPI